MRLVATSERSSVEALPTPSRWVIEQDGEVGIRRQGGPLRNPNLRRCALNPKEHHLPKVVVEFDHRDLTRAYADPETAWL
jgi:hypothetical protein